MGDRRQGSIALPIPEEPALDDIDNMGRAIPFPDQAAAGFERGASGGRFILGCLREFGNKTLRQAASLVGLQLKG